MIYTKLKNALDNVLLPDNYFMAETTTEKFEEYLQHQGTDTVCVLLDIDFNKRFQFGNHGITPGTSTYTIYFLDKDNWDSLENDGVNTTDDNSTAFIIRKMESTAGSVMCELFKQIGGNPPQTGSFTLMPLHKSFIQIYSGIRVELTVNERIKTL